MARITNGLATFVNPELVAAISPTAIKLAKKPITRLSRTINKLPIINAASPSC